MVQIYRRSVTGATCQTAKSLVAAILLTSISAPLAFAEHFDIQLQISSKGKQVNAATDTTPPIGGVNPRTAIHVKPGDPLKITWRLSSSFPHGTIKGVTVHFFVVKEAAVGQKPVPDPSGAGGIVNNSFTTDFAPKSSSGGTLQIAAPPEGNYLVRVQSEDTHAEHDHEHFSAIDLVVD